MNEYLKFRKQNITYNLLTNPGVFIVNFEHIQHSIYHVNLAYLIKTCLVLLSITIRNQYYPCHPLHVTVADQCRFVIKGALPSNQWSAMQNKSNVQRFQILQYLKVGWESL